MTDQERDLITRFIARIAGARPAGSVPAAPVPLPPIDPAANALIADLLQQYPDAAYRLTQVAIIQEQALAQAQARLAAQPPAPQPAGGVFGTIFGPQSRPAPSPPPQPQPYLPYPPPGAMPGPTPGFQPPPSPQPGFGAGGGFLGSALTTAAGVAGGVLAADALMGLFEGPRAAPFGYDQPIPQADIPASGSAWDNLTESTPPAAGWDQNTDPGPWDNSGTNGGGGTGTGGF